MFILSLSVFRFPGVFLFEAIDFLFLTSCLHFLFNQPFRLQNVGAGRVGRTEPEAVGFQVVNGKMIFPYFQLPDESLAFLRIVGERAVVRECRGFLPEEFEIRREFR